MSFQSIDPFRSTGTILDLIAQKQKALGENLANLDTPGYVRKDVNFGEYLSDSDTSLETTMGAKLGHSPITASGSDEPVNPANELMEMQKNSLLYSMATRRMSSVITEMKTVINVGK